jgi:hypothetical protein
MILADKLKTLTTFTHHNLQMAMGKRARGYEFTGAKFLGMTNGGQFCYSVVFRSEDFEGTDSTKVYISYDSAQGQISASF